MDCSDEGPDILADDSDDFSLASDDVKKETIVSDFSLASDDVKKGTIVSHNVVEQFSRKLSVDILPEETDSKDGIPKDSSRTVVVFDEDGNATAVQVDGLVLENVEPSLKRMLVEDNGHTLVVKLNASGELELDPLAVTAVQGEGDVLSVKSNNEENVGTVNQNWFTSREDKSSLQSKGHTWRQGMWSKDEIELLQCNINKYCEDHGFMEPSEIIFDMSKDQRKDFYRVVAKGINRPLFSVYRRVIRMYDNKNHIGKYNQCELQKLRELRAKHGNDWQKIGVALGRSASSIRDRCRLMKENCNTGKWLPDEEERLARAVYDLTNAIPGEQVTSGISWSLVADRVMSRSEKQCRTKWLNYLNWKHAGGSEWTREDDTKLIARLMCLEVIEENEIDWAELAKGWLSVRSPQWLRGKWWNLKRHLQGHQNLPFKEICRQLYLTQPQILGKTSDADISTVNLPVTVDTGVQTPSALDIANVTPTALIVPHLGIVTTPVILDTQVTPIVTSALTSQIVEDDSGTSVTTVSNPTCQVTSAVEVLPHNLVTSTPTILIGCPVTTSLATDQASSQGVFIHTVPAESLASNENVTVQVNPSAQLIISSAEATSLFHSDAADVVGAELTTSSCEAVSSTQHKGTETDAELEDGLTVLDASSDAEIETAEATVNTDIMLNDPILANPSSPLVLDVKTEKSS